MRIFWFFILFIFFAAAGRGQTKYHVATRIVKEDIPYNGQRIHINAQIADIQVYTSGNKQLEVEVKLIAKSPNLTVAKKTLQAMEFVKEVQRNDIFLNNYIVFQQKPDQQTVYKFSYKLYVPENVTINIQNSQGNIALMGVSGNMDIKHKMGELKLDRCSGKLKVDHTIGNLEIIQGNLQAVVKTSYVDVALKQNKKNISIETQFGSVTANLNKDLQMLTVHGSNTDVNLINTECHIFNYKLISSNGNISLNECIKMGGYVITNTTQSTTRKKEFEVKKRPDKSIIEVSTKFGDINIY